MLAVRIDFVETMPRELTCINAVTAVSAHPPDTDLL
jgi:hypothetical protein